MPNVLLAWATVCPCASSTSACRNLLTICSAGRRVPFMTSSSIQPQFTSLRLDQFEGERSIALPALGTVVGAEVKIFAAEGDDGEISHLVEAVGGELAHGSVVPKGEDPVHVLDCRVFQ